MEAQKQFDQVTLGLWLLGIYGGAFAAFIWEPSTSLRASVVFCVAIAFIPLLIWPLIRSQKTISDRVSQLRMVGIAIAVVVIVALVLDAVFGLGTGLKLALVFVGYMVFAGVTAWQTVLYSLTKTLPSWLFGGLVTGLLTGWIADLPQEDIVKQSAVIITFSVVMGVAAMTGRLESGVNPVLSMEPPSEGESAIH